MPPLSQQPSALRAAYCDVDGTLTHTTIVTPLLWFKRRHSPAPLGFLWMLSLALRGPWWLLLDRINRGASNRAIYSSYAGMPAADLRASAGDCHRECIRPRVYPQALQKLHELSRDGVKIVLVTGGIDFILQPLADELNAELIAPGLVESGGRFTGALTTPALTGKHKADAVRRHAAENNVELSASFALGDAHGDLEMLECVGHPLPVNADTRLKQIARERNWPLEQWRLGGAKIS